MISSCAKGYIIEFDSQGGNDIKSIKLNDLNDQIIFEIPERDGFKFLYWTYNGEKVTEDDVVNLLISTKKIELYAFWEESITSSYKVRFVDESGNSLFQEITVKENDILARPEDPSKTGYVFDGWYLNNSIYIFNQVVTSDITLIGKFVLEDEVTTKYNVNINIDGVLTTYKVNSNATVSRPADPIKNNYDFDGWYVDDILFDFATPITKDITIIAKFTKSDETNEVTVTFDSNGGSSVDPVTIPKGTKVSKPANPTNGVLIFEGWYLNNILFNFDSNVVNSIKLVAKWKIDDSDSKPLEAGGYFESLWAEFEDSNVKNAKAQYSKSGENNWINVDSELLRNYNNKARLDIVGLKEGNYDIKVITSNNEVLIARNVYTMRHDRSGYAHFNYTEGVGAYKDDGTLKDNAVVVYVTEENKDSITIEGLPNQVGLGYILNNSQYKYSQSPTYNQETFNSSLATFNRPIAIRLIGKITVPKGATEYGVSYIDNNKENGGSMKIYDAKDITIEGIGEDALIEGWGFSYISHTPGRGCSFEIRNITFDKYPEDAIGMEGLQEGNNLISPAERGWFHNLTMYRGYHPSPIESDKKDGDGTIDVKKGNNFTISYNKIINTKKTHLVGGDDSDKQTNITYHHNYWKDVETRLPLARYANIHMYNNVFENNSKGHDLRMDSYIFTESNYYIGNNTIGVIKKGAIKSYNDLKYGNKTVVGTVVANREDKVSNNNVYKDFDTNPEVFYYDAVNKKSDVERLTSPVIARAEVNEYAGVYKKYSIPEKIKVTDVVPTLVTENINVTTKTTINQGTPLLVFEIKNKATFSMNSTESTAPHLIDLYGELMLLKSGTVELNEGIYILESSTGPYNSKKSSVASYSLVFK